MNLSRFALVIFCLAGCSGSSSSSSTNSNPVTMSPANGSTLATGTVGQVYTATFTVVSGGTAPYKLIPAGTPGGLAFTTPNSYSGTLSGTPTQSGQGTFSLQVIDAANATTDLSYVLTIDSASGGAVTLSPATAANGTHGTTYSQQFSVSGGNAPYSWSVSSGTLPPGLTLGAYSTTTSTDSLTGTPTTAGTYTFTIQVVDGSTPTQTASVSYTITIS